MNKVQQEYYNELIAIMAAQPLTIDSNVTSTGKTFIPTEKPAIIIMPKAMIESQSKYTKIAKLDTMLQVYED